MGRNVIEVLENHSTLKVVAGVDRLSESTAPFPIFETIEACDVAVDCIIDFSHYSVVPSLIQYAMEHRTPIVICTTGLTDETEKHIIEASKVIPVFRSGNMSLGINLLIALAKKAATLLEDDFDIEIIEKHHNRKVDAPSGTAKMIAEGINDVIKSPKTLLYGRHGNETKRSTNEMTIHAVRGGTIVGEHDVLFAGIDEVITISHSAQSKKVFAKGAVNAALFLESQKPGLYDMNHIFSNI
ncbi:4-hydroxy-tetrahydrodipicolinate reductase [Fusibacter sp. Q10-2]|uniref:4-hydroxy-tetrahydrodipicolinate reductase n=2 Tax=Fusibacter ferrireducens TaxID=2785058 RepID=A0ABR9ZR44_9FIRM|nr:4-hydroxy-tetrahydrodipicolinate reductase [Fusibacter ferrireducens]